MSFHSSGSRTLLDVGFTRLDEVTITAPDGVTGSRYVLRLPDAVAVVPVGDGMVTLIEQYRAPHDVTLLEIPAGMLDVEGEAPEDAAIRELKEEVGLTATTLTHLADVVTSPGVTDEVIAIFLGEGVGEVDRTPHGLEERFARVVTMPLDQAVAKALAGEIPDAKTVVGLLLASLR